VFSASCNLTAAKDIYSRCNLALFQLTPKHLQLQYIYCGATFSSVTLNLAFLVHH